MSASRVFSNSTPGSPLCGMPIAEVFLSDNEKTFQHDEELPSLPVPSLHQTLSKYLDSGAKSIFKTYFVTIIVNAELCWNPQKEEIMS